jgi:hypothetical protein
MGRVGARSKDVERAVDAFVDEQRARCLWFLRADYYPATLEERLSVLDQIARRGDRAAFVRAAELRQWLSRPSSEPSPGC